ncbi:MAG: ABC transporter ATP-binding protein [Spirochaetes bacterium]|nr:ABC transporter ATP-binding protein [Spirochaetota bacterium]
MIDIKNLSLVINNAVILDDISLTVNDGETIGIIGKSGSGKTMFLKTVAGLVAPSDGIVLFNGARLPKSARTAGTIVSYCGGAVPHNPDEGLYNFLLLARMSHKKALRPFSDFDRQVAEEYIQVFGLGPFRDRSIGLLPDGIFRRVLLAYALIRGAGALILDNPTNDLDIVSLKMLKKAIARYVMNGKRVALVCANDLNFITQTADRLIVMEDGRIAETGTVDMINADLVKQYFGIDVIISRNIYTGKPEIHFFPDT